MSKPFDENPIALTLSQRETVQRWVDDRKRELALSDWSVTVSAHASATSAIAASFIRDEADVAVIALGADWRDLSPDELRESLTHELLHPHFHRPTRMAMTLIEKELGQRTEAVIEAAVRRTEEIAIDRLATALARFLPLVEVSKEVVDAAQAGQVPEGHQREHPPGDQGWTSTRPGEGDRDAQGGQTQEEVSDA